MTNQIRDDIPNVIVSFQRDVDVFCNIDKKYVKINSIPAGYYKAMMNHIYVVGYKKLKATLIADFELTAIGFEGKATSEAFVMESPNDLKLLIPGIKLSDFISDFKGGWRAIDRKLMKLNNICVTIQLGKIRFNEHTWHHNIKIIPQPTS